MKSKTHDTDRNGSEISFLPLTIYVIAFSFLALCMLFPTIIVSLGAYHLPKIYSRTEAVLLIIPYLFYLGHLASLIIRKVNYWFWLASSITFTSLLFGIVAYNIYLDQINVLSKEIFGILILFCDLAPSLYYFYIAFKLRKNLI